MSRVEVVCVSPVEADPTALRTGALCVLQWLEAGRSSRTMFQLRSEAAWGASEAAWGASQSRLAVRSVVVGVGGVVVGVGSVRGGVGSVVVANVSSRGRSPDCECSRSGDRRSRNRNRNRRYRTSQS
ncbi:uncharacterized protein SCHCODRAFT_02325947 [Schizophyllum commune H4-8]|uniref:uncharacterized protein n=1 Tax=Schizophyllum commune (strain H4-8 / FGSC 9210) TaxID=578458 RepID=UPI00215E0DA4|nr:uncharacterized protein SCHCODRAFT_02325947 [Schizophyllum commune H4-8]KAI5891672.1 hypothetical protein SCHCODRAFT_02325947 [Schizophyllum commune H4-8]